jgi:hypothetical protein
MPRIMVGLLAAAGAIMAALVGLVHGDFVPAMIAGSGTATGLAAYLALLDQKKYFRGAIGRLRRTGNGTALMAGPRSASSFR